MRHRLVVATGLAAALPVIVSTVQAVTTGWLPLGDDATTAVRAYDVLSLHPPLLGPYSASSSVIGEPVLCPGPLVFWLLALPVRLGEVAPAIAIGIVNTAAIVGVVALARRRGGWPLMLAAAAAVAVTCGSLDAPRLHDVWGPAAAVLPFTLLIFLAWSLACGEYRLLPVTVLVASFTVQAHLTYILPAAVLLAVGGGLLAASRPRIPRRWLVATLAVAIVCWSFPVVEEAIHRPGNVERIVRTATAGKPRLGAADGWHSVVRAVGVAPWWIRPPRAPFTRLAEVGYAAPGLSTATAVLALLALAAVAVAGLRARRRELAAGALLALGLMISLLAVAASTPTSADLFNVIAYTLWWASPAGMFAWLVLGFAAVTLLAPARRLEALRARWRAQRPLARLPAAAGAAAGVLGVAAVGALVAAGGKPDRLEHLFRPARTIVDRVRAEAPAGRGVLVTGAADEVGFNVQSAVVYALRSDGVRFVSRLQGLGTHNDPGRHPHDSVMEVADRRGGAPGPGRVIARVTLVDVPADALPSERGPRPVVVTLRRAEPGGTP